MQTFIHEGAPDLLLDWIAKLNALLAKHKAKNPGSEQLQFYEELLRTMRYAYKYMRETQFVWEQYNLLKIQHSLLSRRLAELQAREDERDLINKLKVEGRLEQAMQEADQYVEYVMSLKNAISREET